MKLEIDYGELTPTPATLEPSDWEPPVHKYFGKKLPNGKTEKEPIYAHIEYPRLMYSLKNNKIVAKMVRSDAERDSLGEDWKKTPGDFGYLTAPSFDQVIKMKAEEEFNRQMAEIEASKKAEEVAKANFNFADEPRKVGRPAKA